MFDLDHAIREWRRQMAVGGIKPPEVLDELESHLRDDIAQQTRAGIGIGAQPAFEAAVQRIGQADVLEREFDRAGEKGAAERVKDAILVLAGIPNQGLTTSMNTSNYHLEPRWATYVKSGAFLLPAVSLWAFSITFLFPRVQLIFRDSGFAVPGLFKIMMGVMIIIRDHGTFLCAATILILALLEWRSVKWPRYRRASLGGVVFLLNCAVLVMITAMFTLALMAAPALFAK